MKLSTCHLVRLTPPLVNPSWRLLRENWLRLPWSEAGSLPNDLMDRMKAPIDTLEEHSQLTSDVASYVAHYFASLQQPSTASSPASQTVYTIETLRVYDSFVWGFNSPFLWGIDKKEIQQLYLERMGESHAEVAVGTGLFLEHALREQELASSPPLQQLALLDLNPNTLEECEVRLKPYFDTPTSAATLSKTIWDVWSEPPDYLQNSFDSVAANFLLHCLNGESLIDKRAVVQNCAKLLKDSEQSVFLGSTILGKDLLENSQTLPASVNTIKAFNDNGIFGNRGDSYSDMVRVLVDVFEDVQVWRSGHCAVWKASKRRQD
jgi:hypothetical protein